MTKTEAIPTDRDNFFATRRLLAAVIESPWSARLAPLLFLLLASLLLPTSAFAKGKPAIELEGTWYVLIHYRDSSTANPDVDRWDERLWSFTKKGSRVQWSEYPIVVFESNEGRFGATAGNPRSRILAAWEPNADQLSQIKSGLPVNSRGVLKKSLRGSDEKGYQSMSSMRASGAMMVGYQQTWTIDSLMTKPVFTRDDTIGTGVAIATKNEPGLSSGRTRYATLEVNKRGSELTGRFQRDENREGTFRMMRAGAPKKLPSDERTPNEKMRDRTREKIRSGYQKEGFKQFLATLDKPDAPDIRARLGDKRLRQIWAKHAEQIIGGDARARSAIEKEVREAYIEAVQDDLTLSFLANDGSTSDTLARAGVETDPEQERLAKLVREELGTKRIAELREKYADRIEAGDPEAKQEVREILREAVASAVEADMRKRLGQGDADAVRQYKEYQRKKQDRRL